jgi:hypothetical protein
MVENQKRHNYRTDPFTNFEEITWSLKNGTNSINPVDFPANNFPQWNSNVTNEYITPVVNYN